MANYIQLGGEVIGLRDNGDNTKSLRVIVDYPKRVSTSFSRPGNATQYSAGDQVSDGTANANPITFGTCVPEAGRGFVIGDAIIASSFNQATKPNFRMYLFGGTAAPAVDNDNANWAPTDADINNCLGWAEFTSWEVGGTTVGANGNCFSRHGNLNIVVQPGAATQNIWGLLVERGTYTPGSLETFSMSIGIL